MAKSPQSPRSFVSLVTSRFFKKSLERNGSLRTAGFTLLESLVALALMGIALLLTMALLTQEPQIQRRLDAHVEVLEILDAAHESVRAGRTLRLGRNVFDWPLLYDPPRATVSASGLKIWIEVQPAGTVPGLFEVSIQARYLVGLQSFDRSVVTLAWRR